MTEFTWVFANHVRRASKIIYMTRQRRYKYRWSVHRFWIFFKYIGWRVQWIWSNMTAGFFTDFNLIGPEYEYGSCMKPKFISIIRFLSDNTLECNISIFHCNFFPMKVSRKRINPLFHSLFTFLPSHLVIDSFCKLILYVFVIRC